MLNPIAFAHAATIVTVIFYLVCWLVSAMAPDFVFSIAKSWLHSVSLETLKLATPMPSSTAIFGLVTLVVLTWVTTYGTIWLYNLLAKKK